MPLPFIGILAVTSMAIIAYSLWPKKAEKDGTIRRRMRGQSSQAPATPLARTQRESMAKRFVSSVAPTLMRPVMLSKPEEMSKLRVRLANAGYRGDNVVTLFLASKTIVAGSAALLAALYAWSKGQTLGQGVGAVVFWGALGFMLPNLWLKLAISSRGEKIRAGLPDTLDLMVISVESGLGLDAAIQRVGDEMRHVHPVVSEELQIVTLESQMGIPRSEALAHFDERSGIPEVKSLVAIVNQAERFGTSIAKALRNQSDSLRTKRRQKAEERAQQTAVKLMVPLILFIFPAIMVVLVGPAALRMYENLAN
ncbi:MAG TPA: type II secretion system F family protein [Phycisphaerae bacterium]|nr:type II secretion system F family protein [Phycisphaerae bacterium]HNU43777.1 type II secretion system F family protein [Phycisphaerae bacterium]